MTDDTRDLPRPVATKEAVLWLGVNLVIAFVGWVKLINLLSFIAYLALALQLVNAIIAWRMARKLVATRTPPPPLFAGETATVVGKVRNRSRTRAIAVVREAGVMLPRSWFLPALAAGESAEFTGLIDYRSRGRHKLPAVEAVSGYPFGLIQFRRPLDPGGEVVVLPALGGVDLPELRRWLLRSTAATDASRRVLRRAAPADGDVRGIRPYRQGDSPRDVHWKTSARRDQLLVREYDRTPPMDLFVVVDPWVPSVPTDRLSAGKLEWALSVAVSVAWAWVHGELPGHVTLLVGGTVWTIRGGPGTPAFVRAGFAPLADATGATTVGPIPPELLRGASRASRLVITTRANSPVVAQLRAGGVSVAVAEPSRPLPWFTPRKVEEK
jgi:uncharacterized protein (DUF58 family)